MTVRQKLLYRVDNWRFWMTIAYIVLAFMLFALYFVSARSGRALAHTARDEAIHQAEIESARKSAIHQCLATRPFLIKFNGFVGAVEELHEVIAKNSLRAWKATPRSDRQWTVRRNNYLRVKATIKPVKRIKFPVPTKKECHKRR